MEGLGSFLFFALFFYLMMRFGCGAHLIRRHRGKHDESPGVKFTDPVCSKEVEPDQGYGMMHHGNLYRFCSKKCLDQFESEPALFILKAHNQEVRHEH